MLKEKLYTRFAFDQFNLSELEEFVYEHKNMVQRHKDVFEPSAIRFIEKDIDYAINVIHKKTKGAKGSLSGNKKHI